MRWGRPFLEKAVLHLSYEVQIDVALCLSSPYSLTNLWQQRGRATQTGNLFKHIYWNIKHNGKQTNLPLVSRPCTCLLSALACLRDQEERSVPGWEESRLCSATAQQSYSLG